MPNVVSYLVPIVAIIGGITYVILHEYFKMKRVVAESVGSPGTADAVRQSNETNAKLLEKLDSLDARLTSIEKTLNDVA